MATRVAFSTPALRAELTDVPGARPFVQAIRSGMGSQAANAPLSRRWEVRLLGAVELRCGDVRLTRLSSRPITALMAALALRPQQRHAREQLTELLWPGVAPDVGRNRFRSALSTLRSLLEPPGCVPGSVLSADRLTVQWRPATVVCDVTEFERLVQAGLTESARSHYGGSLLPGFYDDWVVAERDRLDSLADRLPPSPPVRATVSLVDASPADRPGSAAPMWPVCLGAFFGRADDLQALRAAMDQHRLVTLCGMAGVGKTRLATEFAHRLAGRVQVHFVGLADCTAVGQVIDRLQTVLQVPVSGPHCEQPWSDRLAARLGDEPVWMVLDNYEQLADEGGVRVVEALLARMPQLRLLLTSRRSLQLIGERVLSLSPLPMPAVDATLVDAARNPAVALFVDRTRAIRRDFQVCDRNLADVVRICRLLEGLPLALELAAGRARAYALSDMRKALEQGDTALLCRPVRACAGHQHASLHAAIDRSWQLLDPPERRLASALAVLHGGWTAAAARAVSGQQDAHDLLESLVHDSLVHAGDDGDGGLRFTMPESVRAFARARMPDVAQQA